MSISGLDQQVWKKVLAHKNSSMNESQLANSLPLLRPRDMQEALANLLKFGLMTVSITPAGDKMYNAQKSQARTESLASLTPEQKLVKSVIDATTSNGIPITKLKRSVNPDSVPHANLRKILVELEKSGHIKKFSAVSAPTTVLYHSSKFKPAAHLTGGVWYDDNKEFDEGLVQVVRDVLLDHVRKRTFKGYGDKHNKNGESSTVNNQIYPAGRTPTLPSPKDLLAYIKKLNVVQAQLTKTEIKEVMRALVLDDLVEIIKPVGGMNRDDDSDDEDDDDEPVRKKVKGEHGVDEEDEEMDDDEKERKKELAKEKEKERQRAKKKREKEKEKQKEKEKEKERKKREKEKERERKRKKKEKEKAKKKKRKKAETSSDSDSDAADSLVEVGDEEAQKKRQKNSRSKKRAKSSSSSSGSESSDESSSSDDSDDSVSSVNSSDIDNVKSTSRRHRPVLADGGVMVLPAGLQDISDDQIVYRATNRMTVPLGQTEVPCGKCPVFDFCAEGGPVNAEECEYWEGWLDGGKGGGWVGEDKIQERKENEEMMEEGMNQDGMNGGHDGLMAMDD